MEDLNSIEKSQQNYQAKDREITVLESGVIPKEMESVAVLNPEKKECSDVSVQANYLEVAECKAAINPCYV